MPTSTQQEFLSKIFSRPSDTDSTEDSVALAVQDDEGDSADSSSNEDEADRSAYEELEHTERSAADSPINRALFWFLVVGASSGMLLFVASRVNFSDMANSNKPAEAVSEEPEEVVDEAIALDETEGQLAFSEQDVDQANATAFLDAEERAKKFEESQKRANESANQTTATPPSSRATPAPAPATPRRAPVTSQNTVRVPRTTYIAPRRAYTPPTRNPQPIKRRPTVPAVKPVVTPSSPVPAPPKEVNAAQLYASFNDIGRYGSANWNGKSQQSLASPVGQNQVNPILASSNFDTQPGNIDDGFLSGVEQDVYLVPGETLEITLNLPIFWSDSRSAPRTLATVTKGNQYLPAGTQLSVAAGGDNSGLVRISEIAIIDGNSTIPLSGSMQITKPNGKPLKAKKKGGPSFFSKIGVKTLLGLGASVASNALSGDSVTINNGSTSVQQDRGVLSDVLQSGSNELLGELQNRSDSALDRQQSQEYFIVESGKNIKISAVSNVGG